LRGQPRANHNGCRQQEKDCVRVFPMRVRKPNALQRVPEYSTSRLIPFGPVITALWLHQLANPLGAQQTVWSVFGYPPKVRAQAPAHPANTAKAHLDSTTLHAS